MIYVCEILFPFFYFYCSTSTKRLDRSIVTKFYSNFLVEKYLSKRDISIIILMCDNRQRINTVKPEGQKLKKVILDSQ